MFWQRVLRIFNTLWLCMHRYIFLILLSCCLCMLDITSASARRRSGAPRGTRPSAGTFYGILGFSSPIFQRISGIDGVNFSKDIKDRIATACGTDGSCNATYFLDAAYPSAAIGYWTLSERWRHELAFAYQRHSVGTSKILKFDDFTVNDKKYEKATFGQKSFSLIYSIYYHFSPDSVLKNYFFGIGGGAMYRSLNIGGTVAAAVASNAAAVPAAGIVPMLPAPTTVSLPNTPTTTAAALDGYQESTPYLFMPLLQISAGALFPIADGVMIQLKASYTVSSEHIIRLMRDHNDKIDHFVAMEFGIWFAL